MDSTTIKKYFNLGDEVEIASPNTITSGKIVDFSDSVLVVEDSLGNPIIIAIENISSCKKKSEIISDSGTSENGILQETDEIPRIINEIISTFDDIYERCSIPNETNIPTNAIVTGMSSEGVEVLTDDGERVTCVKSSFVGYSRENAAIGKRVFCSPSKDNISYVSLTEMSYGEMHERFIRALNTKPKPRTPILSSVLFLLTKEYSNMVASHKKIIKQLIRDLSHHYDSEVPIVSKRTKLKELTTEQKKSIYALLGTHISSMSEMSENDRIRFADSLISEKLGFKIKRVGVKAIVADIIENGILSLTDADSRDGTNAQSEHNQIHETYIPATSEINKYYIQYHNGLASDSKNTEIRFKDDVIVEESLIEELKQYQWWTKSSQPIPVVCVYKKIGKWQTATFVTKPGSLREFSAKIANLMDSGRQDVAIALQNYLEDLGYLDDNIIHFSEDTPSQELLATTRRKRLIKSFEEAEKGFLEIIRRGYELDSSVRDLAMMYQEWKRIPEAIALIEKNLFQLKDKMKFYNMLFTFYHSTGHDQKAIDVMNLALSLYPGKDVKSKKERNKILHKIEIVKKKKHKAIFSDDDIPSALLRYEANNTTNEVLAYVTDKTTEEKWQFVNQRIGELKNSPDLPAYYLAKIQLLEERGESGSSTPVRMALADYCKARARNFFNEGNESSARVYLLQGISIYEREDLYYLLLISLCASCNEVLAKYNNPANSYENIFNNYSLREENDVFCVLLQLINDNTILSRKLIRYLYDKESTWLFDELDIDNPTPQQFIDTLTDLSNKRHEQLSSFEMNAGNILLESNSSLFGKRILETLSLSSKEASTTDLRNLSALREVADYLIDIEKINLGYEDCEDISRNAFSIIDASIVVIEKSPSPVSTIHLMPLFIKARDMMERNLDKRYIETLPQVTIAAIDDAHLIGDDIELQISISNESGFSRAINGTFAINKINDKDVSKLSLYYALDTPLLGGDKINAVFSVKSSLFKSENIEIDYTFKYLDVRKVGRTKHDKISLAINAGDDYEDFENPYIAHVKSNAVKDKSMFKGRDEIIDTICKYVLEDYKGYVLYGQKRSGKSSVLYHITQRLRAEHVAFAVDYTMGNNIVQDSKSESESMANLFYTIISEIGRAIKEVDRSVYKECGCHIIRRQEFESYPDQTFREYLDFYRDIIVEKLHYKQDKIVLIVDEFTYLYYHILEGKISPRIMEFWKGLVESRVFSFVFAGQDAMPRFMDDFQNVFASMHPQELTYIDEKSARELIEEPIWNKKKNCSRYQPDAVDEIIKLTACSPFYIMIICSELVKYARQRKRLPIQLSDVNALVQKMICNESSISRKDFDNLISCGESRLDIIDKDDSLKVLKDIAVKSRNIDYYDINEIKVFGPDKVKNIIDDLLRRGVLQRHTDFSNKVKIKVGLFKRWLLNHE